MTAADWQPIELELEDGGVLLRVSRRHGGGGTRWAWSVTAIETVQHWGGRNRQRDQWAHGYGATRERAMGMAAAAAAKMRESGALTTPESV